ncbi:MAG TPA: histidine ammonia-lyase [Elusimicrobia bacterium]|nr:MAG: histidine ammonia-lyase [Elusimicrobia bacterium GWF2_62_30]HBA61380.1 histidine ammonia-lyase [Elusimicrobiota bacterium]
MRNKTIFAGRGNWKIEDVTALAGGNARAALPDDPKLREAVDKGVEFIRRGWKSGRQLYGINTGYGASVERVVPENLIEELPRQLVRYHGCGLGRIFDEKTTLAILSARLISLSKGYSGVRWELLENLAALINNRILPLIPEEGSVGASGDLTPLSYIAAALMGERDVLYRGERLPAAAALKKCGLKPLKLMPKEGLAVMNGTSVMTALACLAYEKAAYLQRLSSRITAMCVIALKGNTSHYDEELFERKPHPGQMQVAAWIRRDLAMRGYWGAGARLQDSYSLRCAPHIIGVLADALPWMRAQIETELNSSNDNPLIDGVKGKVMHGGHFYGGHIAFAMDCLKTAVANLADLHDRQLELLVDKRTNHGLPSNLSGAVEERAAINHGFKALQIGTSAWAAEALKLTMPASVFSRSTECHNQDKVSMGTIAARDCLRVLELTEQAAVGALLGALQGIELRARRKELKEAMVAPELAALIRAVRVKVPFVEEDRALEDDLRWLLAQVNARAWKLYER